MATDVLHVQHASMQFSDPMPGPKRDFGVIFARDADVVGFTECSQFHDLLVDHCERNGYTLVQPRRPDGDYVSTAVAVKAEQRVYDSGWVFVVPGLSRKPSEGGHNERGVTWVDFGFHRTRITVAEVHMLTGWSGRDNARNDQILDQWRVSTRLAARAARGARVGILMGDVNYDPDGPTPDTPSAILKEAGLVSVFDLAGTDQGTLGRRQIDQVYLARKDRRVKVDKVKVWTDKVEFTHTDHAQVSAWLSIRRRRAFRR